MTITADECRTALKGYVFRDDPDGRITPTDVFAALATPLGLAAFQPPQGLPPHGGHLLDVATEITAALDAVRTPANRTPSVRTWLGARLTEQGDDPDATIGTLRINGQTGVAWLSQWRRIANANTVRAVLANVRGAADPSTVRFTGTHVLGATDRAIVWYEPVRTFDRYFCNAVLMWVHP